MELIDKAWRTRSATKSQLKYIDMLLKDLGLSFEEIAIPKSRGDASILIMQLRKITYGDEFYEDKSKIKISWIDENGKPADPQPQEKKIDKVEFYSKEELINLGLRKPKIKKPNYRSKKTKR